MKLTLTLKREWGWILFNALVGALFLWLSSHTWSEPELRQVPGASGGSPIFFGLILLYQVIPMLLPNFIWLTLAIRRGRRERDWTSLLLIALIVIAWFFLVCFSASQV